MFKVLIIDDDKLARRGLISMVSWEKYGLTIVGDVANGLQALEFLECHEVDLAFVDLSMPVISGMEFIEQSRQKYPNLKYVILTFHEDFENVQNALRYGVLDYISKLRLEEMNNDEVFARIGRLMENSTENVQEQLLTIGDSESKKNVEISYDRMEELRSDWNREYWIYNDSEFQERKKELQELNISVRQMERLLMWVSQKIETDFEVKMPVPWLSSKEEGFKWIEQARATIRSCAEDLSYYYNMRMCILRATMYTEQHFGEHINAASVAGQINMSRSYFSTSFKNLTGENFNDFLKKRRIERAKEILSRGSVKAAELAEMVGYEDPKYFTKLFQQETGMNCSKYAEQFSTRDNC